MKNFPYADEPSAPKHKVIKRVIFELPEPKDDMTLSEPTTFIESYKGDYQCTVVRPEHTR